jgi:hypothetical protein
MFPVWMQSLSSKPLPNNVLLETNQSITFIAQGVSGRIWGTFQEYSTTMNTLFEFYIPNSKTQLTFYDISLVDGYTLPMTIKPSSTICPKPSCSLSLLQCPSDLQVKDLPQQDIIACNSPCSEFQTEAFCCGNTTPQQCQTGPVVSTDYVKLIHEYCPLVYAYSYDDMRGLHTCSQSNYEVQFC